MRKTGFIAIVGLANAGKSTLLNALIKQKVSIVSPKPQTTRDSIMGIWTDDDSQMVFVDTPGFLQSRNALGDYMLKSIDNAVEDVDCILIVIDGHDGIDEKELKQIQKYTKSGKSEKRVFSSATSQTSAQRPKNSDVAQKSSTNVADSSEHSVPVVVAVTKTDITQPEKLMPELAKLNGMDGISEVFCVSAKRNRGVDELKQALKKYLSGTEMYFEEDDVTDKTQRYLVGETIREKVLLCCEQEIPHGVGVVVNKMAFENNSWDIDATILVEKASHKPIVLGKHGAMIKSIGIHARESIERQLEAKVFLTLWVKVKEDWRNNPSVLNELGYSNKK